MYLNDYGEIGVSALLVQDGVGLDRVVHYVGLQDLLRADLALRAGILTLVVPEITMVVTSGRGRLGPGADQEVDESRLHLGLARLEVVAADKGVGCSSPQGCSRGRRCSEVSR